MLLAALISAVLLYISGKEEKGAVNKAMPLPLLTPFNLTTYLLVLLLPSQYSLI